ncbi:MAG: stage III sporulation protein AA [Syntrophomonadaceae bacterium]|nr:stage III sporulation protein AA [Syntrophomonadaceae bacterium]
MASIYHDTEIIKRELLPFLPAEPARLLLQCEEDWRGLEEIRLRVGRPLLLRIGERDYALSREGGLCDPAEGYMVSVEDVRRTLSAVSENSLYAFEEDIRRGYITVPGGHRVGLAGQIISEDDVVVRMKHFSGIAMRVARQCIGCADCLTPHLFPAPGAGPVSTLLLSPPRCGKTTMLRDVTRTLANGSSWGAPQNVALIDERSELAGCWHGRPQLEVGLRTDVLDACPKRVGMLMALRALSPQVIVTDELGREADAEAVRDCLHAGVTVISSVHANGLEDIKLRPVLRDLLAEGAFELVVLLSRRHGPGTVEAIWQRGDDGVWR